MGRELNEYNWHVEWRNPTDLIPYDGNAKNHDGRNIANIAASIKKYGWQSYLVVTKGGIIVIGHGRRLAAIELGCRCPCKVIEDDLTDAEIRELRNVDNLTQDGDYDMAKLQMDLDDMELDFSDFDFDIDYADEQPGEDDAEPTTENTTGNTLAERFVVPPFSVIDGKQGYYLKRKKAWRELINDDGQARQNASLNLEHLSDNFAKQSLLDPVLSEAMLRWFMPGEHGLCFDVFAGDTVFGYVASRLGHTFTGIELRQEQADYNNAMIAGLGADSKYICDDGRNVLKYIAPESMDMLFSCPPYFDLEVYSDNPNDASNQKTFDAFYEILDTAFANAIKCLKDNRFAIIVCSNIRNKKTGFYYDFTGSIKRTFAENGMQLYNDIILADPIGTAAQRAGGYMQYRKVAKIHQNVLVFYKGDTREIKNLFQPVVIDIADIEGLYESEDLES